MVARVATRAKHTDVLFFMIKTLLLPPPVAPAQR
jgi:hypothetical protein